MANQEDIIQVIADTLTLPPGDIDPTAHLQDDLGLSPIEVADLLHTLSEAFQIRFDPSETSQIQTVGDLIDQVEDKLLE